VKFDIQEFIFNFVKKSITRLFLSFIYILEDLVADNKISEEEFERLRKRILDYGNNTIREINKELKNFDFILTKDDNNKNYD
jgi:hypothetical protein